MLVAKIELGYLYVPLQGEFEDVVARLRLALAVRKVASFRKLPDIITVHDYAAHFFHVSHDFHFSNNEAPPDGFSGFESSRTVDNLINSQVLYLLLSSYHGI